jgi:hypothetical protein
VTWLAWRQARAQAAAALTTAVAVAAAAVAAGRADTTARLWLSVLVIVLLAGLCAWRVHRTG